MVEVVKIMGTSFKRSHAGTAALSASNPAAGHRRPTPLSETPGHSWQVWVSLLRSHCSFLLGPGVHKVLFVPSKSLFPQSCVSSGGSMMGLMATSSTRAYAIPRSTVPRALPLQQATIDLYLHSLVSSVAQSCSALHNSMNRSTPGLPVHHQLPEFTQTHVHRVSDAIQPSHPLSSASPFTYNLSQHQGLFK